MFYCTDILKKNNGRFGAIWLAAFYGKNAKKILGRREIFRVNITKACIDVLHPQVPFSLRLQSNLMLGIMRVYKEQVYYFCNDIKLAWRQLQMALQVEHMRIIDLPRTQLSKDACTMADPRTRYLDGDLGTFPRDIFTKSPAELFSGDGAFITIDGLKSPRDGAPSPPFSPPSSEHSPRSPRTPPPPDGGLTQVPKDRITMPDVVDLKEQPIQIPHEKDITPPIDGGDQDAGHEEPIIPPEPPHGDSDMEDDQQRAQVNIFDPSTFDFVPAPETVKRKRKSFLDDQLRTPTDAGIQVSTPFPPRKRRRRRPPVDMEKKLSDERIKSNVFDVSNTLRDVIVEPPRRASVSELFKNPARPDLREEPFFHYWRQNAITPKVADDKFFYSPPGHHLDSPPSGYHADSAGEEDSVIEPPSIEVLRRQETEDTSAIERSAVSSTGLVETPTMPAEEPSRRSTDGLTPEQRRDRDSLMMDLIGPDLPTIKEDDVEPDMQLPDIDEVVEPPSPVIPDQSEQELLKVVAEKMGSEDETFFHVVFPREETKRRAAKGLFQVLVWHSRSVVVLSQDDHFEPIGITKGTKF